MGKSVTIDKFFQRKRANEHDPATPITPLIRSNNNDLPYERKRANEHDPATPITPSTRSNNNDLPFERKRANEHDPATPITPSTRSNNNDLPSEIPPKRFKHTEIEEVDLHSLERCSNQTAFTVDGFDNWKKVRNGKACAFLGHIGKDNVSSPHRNAEKNVIYSTLAHYNLDVQNIRGQGYDGASNMRDEFNGLQALIIKDCRGAYYVRCFAHRLQLALVAASKNVTPIHQFFDRLTFIVNIVGSSCKRNDELKNAHADDIAHLIAINELETGRGLNQIDTLQRAADTR
ncbi:uncharacterized protein LOC122050621 [Zingiber officinale]|uniref:uncharacterized protein LOC122050621 n=1 Tax=Zingiber officinale TaxID=94328 RepID=UPI001C4AB080|nr:uncharacterized protein LOC122050621 [Zingiber officinale]